MADDRVLVSLINWRRPFNIRALLERYKSQSVPTHVALVECSPGTEFAVPPDVAAMADIVFTINQNLGACSRFIPPLMLPEFKFTFFGVDDHLPGRRHIECLVRCAESLEGKFATIGQDGRVIAPWGTLVKRRARLLPHRPLAVDVVTSSELIYTAHITAAIEFRNEVAKQFRDPSLVSEDDLILCFALQRAVKYDRNLPYCPCYITPACDPDEWWAEERLPAPHALSAREDHDDRRYLFVSEAMSRLGWSPQSHLAAPPE
jgi:hypothetical protein